MNVGKKIELKSRVAQDDETNGWGSRRGRNSQSPLRQVGRLECRGSIEIEDPKQKVTRSNTYLPDQTSALRTCRLCEIRLESQVQSSRLSLDLCRRRLDKVMFLDGRAFKNFQTP